MSGLLAVLLPLVPSCWSCPLESLAVKEGMEPRVEVKAISKLCDSFCSWDTGPVGDTEIMTSRKAQQKRHVLILGRPENDPSKFRHVSIKKTSSCVSQDYEGRTTSQSPGNPAASPSTMPSKLETFSNFPLNKVLCRTEPS